MIGMWKALAAAALALMAAAPAAAAWRRAESAHFVIYSEAGDARIREQAALLEDYHQFLRLLFGVQQPPAPNKLSIYMVRSPAQLRQVRNVAPGIAGFYTASSTGIAAFADDTAAGGDARNEILLHEIAHHFMAQYRPLPYPTWYVEGFAEYVATAQFRKEYIEFGEASSGRVYTLMQVKWLPLERILFGQVPTDRDEMAAFYAQSWLLAHYLLRDDQQRPRLGAYFTAVARGEESRKAFADNFPVPPEALEAQLRAYMKRGMTYTRVKRASAAAAPAVALTRLPQSADDLLLLRATLEVGPEAGGEPALLARIRAAAAKHDGDPFARRVLAQAEALHGDPAKGDALLTELLAAKPDDAELLYFKGMRYLNAAREAEEEWEPLLKEAQKWFARAHKVDKNHFQTLIRYAESLQADRRFVSDNTVNILLLARQLAPQVSEASINAARVLIARQRYAEAEQLLLPLTADPHDTGLAAAARDMLEQAREKRPQE